MKNLAIVLIAVCFISISVLPVFIPQPAHAASGAIAAAATWAATIWKNIQEFVVRAITKADEFLRAHIKSQLVYNSIDLFAQKLAQETAISIAAGDRGQGTLFEGRVFQNILKDAAGAAAGDFIGGLSDEWEDLGIDLCDPELDVKVSITMSLLKYTNPQVREPKCDLAKVVKNWETFVGEKKCLFGGDGCSPEDSAAAQASLLEGLQVQFRPGKSDFSTQLTLNDKIAAKVDESKIIAQLEKLKSSFKPKKNTTGTQEETPVELTEAIAKQPVDATASTQAAKTAATLESPDPGILSLALSTFSNTLAANLMQRWINDGMYDLAEIKNYEIPIPEYATTQIGDGGGGGNGGDGGGDGGGQTENPYDNPITSDAIESYYAGLVTTTFGTIEEYNPLTDFITCPTQADFRTVNNCVMDSKFYSAFNRGEPITVAEAITLKLLNPDLPLISKDSPWHSDLQFCHKQALCYSNLQKMRLARLIPLGWEIAASKSNPEDPITLGEVMAAFEPSDDNPNPDFKRLIDPNWLLIAPAAQCRATGYGPILEATNASTRGEICVDTQTCLQTDSDGNCLPGAWGYCTREQNVWQFGGDQCASVYASCQSYRNDNQTNYYIKDTLDFCDAGEVGCQWYSTEKSFSSEQFNNEDTLIDCDGGGEKPLRANQETADAFCRLKGYDRAFSNDGAPADVVACSFDNSTNTWSSGEGLGVFTSVSCERYGWEEDSKIYLNGQAGTCEGQNAGCTELIKVEPGVNLVYNGSFEIKADGNNNPDGWSLTDTVARVNNTSSNGDYSIQAEGAWKYARQEIDIASSAVYTISVSAKELGGGLAINLRFKDSDGNWQDPVSDEEIDSGDTDWRMGCGDSCHLITVQGDEYMITRFKRFSFEFVSPDNVNGVRLSVGASNSPDDQVYIDSVQMEVGPNNTTYSDYASRNLSYIKKAPDYLDCVDDSGNWTCDNYAPMCEADEIGCDLYIPTNGDPAIPGIVAVGDYCDAECSGYERYLQENTELDGYFATEDINDYHDFIADTAQSCNLADVGCEAFTNLTEGEAVEYYSFLRMCVEDINPNVTTYYTWEGSETAGYELRVWQLLRSDIEGNNGPCTNIVFNGQENVCNDISEDRIQTCDENDLDCRVYVDENNNEYYRLESKVVKASSSCSLVRRAVNNTDMAMILPSESVSCSAEVVGCKTYRGNDGSNTRRVFVDDFENSSGGWSTGSLSSASVVAGGHSLKVQQDINSRGVDIQAGKTYTLSFWLKGNFSDTIQTQISFNNQEDYLFNNNYLTIVNDWRQYHLGPVYFTGDSFSNELNFNIVLPSSTDYYYVDNIILKEINSDLYLIRDSWSTPAQCTVADFGCDEYEDRAGDIHYLSSFDSLCSEDVVGCSMFIDTKNTDTVGEKLSPDESVTIPADEMIYLVDDNKYYCSSRDKGCATLGWPARSTDADGNTVIDNWYDVYMINDPDRYELTWCGEDALDCKAYQDGAQIVYFKDPRDKTCTYLDNYEFDGAVYTGWYKTSSVEDVYTDLVSCGANDDLSLIKRRDWPAEGGYTGLCNAAAVGCTEFIDPQGTRGDNVIRNGNMELWTSGLDTDGTPIGAPDFWCTDNVGCTGLLRDESLAAEGRDRSKAVVAEYKDPDDNNAFSQSFTIKSRRVYGVLFDIKFDQDGGSGDFSAGIQCDSGDIRSYDNSFGNMGGGLYEMNILPSDVSNNLFYTFSGKFEVINTAESEVDCEVSFGGSSGSRYSLDNVAVRELSSYYYINNKEVNSAECNGQASWDKGCILTLDTSNVNEDGEINRLYNSSKTYNNSYDNNGRPVSTAPCDMEDVSCDANRVVKVVPNRECSEWIACRSASYATQLDGTVREYCYDLGRCVESLPGGDSCVRWSDREDAVLTEGEYTSRETGWSGNEYSGYSLLNKFNLEALLAKNITERGNTQLELTYENEDELGDVGVDNFGNTIPISCRLFPDAEAPFATTGLNITFDDYGNILQKPATMPQANFCYQGSACECDYTKVTYSMGEVRYFDDNYSNIQDLENDPDDDTDDSSVQSVQTYNGFWGFCLEYDYSRNIKGNVGEEYPCLTWMPLDILSGEYNPAGANIAADMGLDFDQMYYCLQAEGNYPYDSDALTEHCTIVAQVGAPKFNTFVNGGEYPEDLNVGRSNWYGVIDVVDGDSINGVSAINVQHYFGRDQNDYYIDVAYSVGNSPSTNSACSIDGRGCQDSSDCLAVDNYCLSSGYCRYSNSVDTECDSDSQCPPYEQQCSATPNKAIAIYSADGQYCQGHDNQYGRTCALTNETCTGSYCLEENLPLNSANVACVGYSDSGGCALFGSIVDRTGTSVLGTVFTNQDPDCTESTCLDVETGCYSVTDNFSDLFAVNSTNDNWWSGFFTYVKKIFFKAGIAAEYPGSEFCGWYDSNTGMKYFDTGSLVDCSNNSTLCGQDTLLQTSCSGVSMGRCQPIDPLCEIQPAGTEIECTTVDDCINYVVEEDAEAAMIADFNVAIIGDEATLTCDYGACDYRELIDNIYDCSDPYDVSQCYLHGGNCLGVSPDVDGGGFLSLTGDNSINSRTGSSGITQAIDYLSNLFARFVRRYNLQSGVYTDVGTSGGFDDATGDPTNQVVTVRAVDYDDATGIYSEGDLGFTINGKNGDDLPYNGSVYNATIKFYAYNANGNQSPLRRLMINWDDGSTVFDSGDAALKNHQNMCVNNCENSILDGEFTNAVWEVYTAQGDGGEWNGGVVTVTQPVATGSDGHNWTALRLESPSTSLPNKFAVGDLVTIEYDFKIPNNMNAPAGNKNIDNYICYSFGYCSQAAGGVFEFSGQSNAFPRLKFDEMVKAVESGNDWIYPNTDQYCPDGSPSSNGWCHYSSTRKITPEFINGCVHDGNPSGYCLKDIGIRLNYNPSLIDSQSYKIKNYKLRIGCRSNAECQFTKYGSDLGSCEAVDIGDDLRYCVDDYDNSLGYFSFSHTYICDDPEDTTFDGDYTACVYTPKIYVEDNWGWCSEGYGEDECYATEWVDGMDSSNICDGDNCFGKYGWLKYGGEIRLTP